MVSIESRIAAHGDALDRLDSGSSLGWSSSGSGRPFGPAGAGRMPCLARLRRHGVTVSVSV